MIGPEALAPYVQDVMQHAVAGDLVQASHVLDQVAEHGDWADMYGLCVAVADFGWPALLAVVDAPCSWLHTVAATERSQHRRFAALFLMNHLLDDWEMTAALYASARQGGEPGHADSVRELVAFTAALHRWADPTTHTEGHLS